MTKSAPTSHVLTFEYPLPGGGQVKISAHGIWEEGDCDTLDEFFPLITKAMRKRVQTAGHTEENS